MTNTPDAVRLAGLLEQWARDYAGTTYEEDTLTQAAALLRRFPELEADVQEQARLNGMGAERELALRAQVSRLEAGRDQLRAWQQAAFAAHPNIDLDIEAAITPPHADQKGQ